jgi:predicted DNA-binding protein
MAKSPEIRSAPVGLRLRPSLKAELEDLAKQEGRTLANYIERILEAKVEVAKTEVRKRR